MHDFCSGFLSDLLPHIIEWTIIYFMYEDSGQYWELLAMYAIHRDGLGLGVLSITQ